MRYAIVSDLHANIRSWDAVLADIRAEGVDTIVCLGDVVGYGPKPAEVLEAVRSVTDHFVMGNHDAAAVGLLDYSIFNEHAREAIEWTMGQLNDEAKEFLKAMPLAIEAGDTLFVHAEAEEPGRFHYIDSVEIAQSNFAVRQNFVTFVGHTHLPKVFEQQPDGEVHELADETCQLNPDSRYIVNVGSVGEPRNPEDLRARYVIYDDITRKVDFRRVEFDIVAYRADLESTSLSLRPFFLRTYEFLSEGRDVVVSNGGSLVDMRITQGSAALVNVGPGSRIVQLSSPTLASVQPSRKPAYLIGSAAALALGGLAYWATSTGEDKTSPSVVAAPVEAKAEPKTETISRQPEEMSDRSPEPEETDPDESMAQQEAAVPTPEPEEIPEEPREKTAQPKPIEKPAPVIVEKKQEVLEEAWWHLDGEGAESDIMNAEGGIPLAMLKRGKKIGAVAPEVIPLTQTQNPAALLAGVWQEEKPSGIFRLSPDQSLTVEGWMVVGSFRKPIFVLGTRSGGSDERRGWHLDLRPPARGTRGEQMAFFYDDGQEQFTALTEPMTFSDKQPHHFALSWDHDSGENEGTMSLRLDGKEVATTTVPHSKITDEQVSPFRIGAARNKSPLGLDELRVTRRHLSRRELLLTTPTLGAVFRGGPGDSADSWADSSCWEDDVVPSSDENIIIAEGTTARVRETPPSPYSKNLVLKKGASLVLQNSTSLSALPLAPGAIEFYHGAQLYLRAGKADLGPILLHGDATIHGGPNGSGGGSRRHFTGLISGDGKLNLNGVSQNEFRFETPMTWTGGISAYSETHQSFFLSATANGALGTGDITLESHASLVIFNNLSDTIADDAALILNGSGSMRNIENSDPAAPPLKLILHSDETVGAFIVDGKDLGEGSFSKETHSFIGGPGTLTVVRPG